MTKSQLKVAIRETKRAHDAYGRLNTPARNGLLNTYVKLQRQLGLIELSEIAQTVPFPIGSTVRFSNPEFTSEASERFTVVEDRDTRVLVTPLGFDSWVIRPQTVFAKSDLELV